MNRKGARIVLSVVVWMLIYLLPHFLRYGRLDAKEILDGAGVIHAVSTALLIGYCYLNYHVLAPKFYLHRQYLLYAGLVAAGAMLVLWFPNVFQPERPQRFRTGPPSVGPPDGFRKGGGPPPLLFGLGYNVILFIIVTLGGISLRQRFQLYEIQKEKMDAELLFLKAQINPHFLFNTLNSIYSLAIQKSDDTPKAVIQLSELMRYLLKDADADYVALEKELAYINNYIALQRRRLGATVRIDYAAPQGPVSETIAPLVLMSFIENAFKHGVNPDRDSAISVSITVENGTLRLSVINNKVPSVHHEGIIGIGLKNVASRLEHLYPGKHELLIENAEKTFSVDLKIELT